MAGWGRARNVAKEPASIGDFYVDAAVKGLNDSCATTISELTDYKHTREQTLPMLFRDDDLHKLKQVLDMVITAGEVRAYELLPRVALHICYADAPVPAIELERLYIQPERAAPLFDFIAEVQAIHDRFEEVKAVLRYLNRNATPGAIRYYWPTALQLCPTSPALRGLVDVPTRFNNPRQISSWVQSIKDSATTVAGSLLLPVNATPKPRGTMWLRFGPRNVHHTVDAHYTTDDMTYFI